MTTATTVGSKRRQVNAAMAAMRTGVGTEAHWLSLASAMAAATRLDQMARTGMREHLDSASSALQAILRRAMDGGEWQPVQLYLGEIDCLQVALDLVELQLCRLVRQTAEAA